MNDLKHKLSGVPQFFIKRRVAIVAIVMLILLGFSLLQINSAISSESDTLSNDANLENAVLGKKVEFKADSLEKIVNLSGDKPDIGKVSGSHSKNPFESN
ncbi:hypothetical protein KBB17_00515 [Candidatus Saccharibacteria bacterium]|nr:hypothetical protein [Candidatus Saccharibacteria bacterium]MBP9131560.1 hypothetical protein [Candidatus Saccharibacteria bacterium]